MLKKQKQWKERKVIEQKIELRTSNLLYPIGTSTEIEAERTCVTFGVLAETPKAYRFETVLQTFLERN